MASASTNRGVRSSTNGSVPKMHLGSFSRMDIADFDSRGRYPTTPSPQEVRVPPSLTQNWISTDPTNSRQSMIQQNGITDDYTAAQFQPAVLNTTGSYDNAGNRGPPTQEGQRKDSKGSADSNLMPVAANGVVEQAAFSDSPIQDTNKAVLPPGPRHPQVPSRASTAPQMNQPQPQAPMRTGSKAPAPYPFTPSTTATQLPLGAQRPVDPANMDQSQFVPTTLNYGSTMLQVQNAPRPQAPPQAEEVCIECMMRDRDMADVIVIGPGIWDRESDAGLHELWAREDEEERAWRDRHAAELAIPGNRLRPPRRASKGHRLTEQNLKIWLTLNPKEADARLMTIRSYVRQQLALLNEEAEARAKTQQETQRVDARMRDTYSQLRQSAYEVGSAGLAGDDPASGVRIQSPRLSMYDGSSSGQKEDYKHKRDMTLLENGMILERVNIKREEKERKREQKKARKLSQTTDVSTLSPGYAPPMSPSGMDGSDFEPSNANMSATSLQVSRPKSAPLGVPLTKYASHASMDGKSPRFMGAKAWQAPWGSGASVAPSGSMMDMHLALDQEHDQQLDQFGVPQPMGRHHAQSSFSLPASPRNPSRPHTADAMMRSRRSGSPDGKVKKSSGIGKLWRMVRPKKSESKHTTSVPSYAQEDDLSTPLPPPPMMPYLANQRQVTPPHVRQTSNSGSQNGYLPPATHPRSMSQPGNMSGGAISPTTAPSSSLPSPTSNRFPWRESTGDDRRQSVIKDLNGDLDPQGGTSPEPNGSAQYIDPNGNRLPLTAGSASSEYGRTLQPLTNNQSTRSPAPSTAILSSSAHSPRPLSSVHKPLPPPPSETSVRHTYIAPRPATMATPGETFIPPAAFREDTYDNRRESFSGATVRVDALPPGAAQSLHNKRSIPAIAYNDGSQPYQDFGRPYDNYGLTPYSNGTLSDGGKSKRRSRFLPFLSKKEKEKDKMTFAPQQLDGGFAPYGRSPSGPLAPPSRPGLGHNGRSRSSASLTTPDYTGNGMQGLSSPSFGYTEGGRPMSGYSTFTNGQRPNKALIDEIVPRDNDFLAYRYPSTEQPLDVSRR